MTRRELFGLVGAAIVAPRPRLWTIPKCGTTGPIVTGSIRCKFEADFRDFVTALHKAELALKDL